MDVTRESLVEVISVGNFLRFGLTEEEVRSLTKALRLALGILDDYEEAKKKALNHYLTYALTRADPELSANMRDRFNLMADNIYSIALNSTLAPVMDVREREYKRVYDELFERHSKVLKEFCSEYQIRKDEIVNGSTLLLRLISDSVGYFSQRICGDECPNSNWANAVDMVLNHRQQIVHNDIHETKPSTAKSYSEHGSTSSNTSWRTLASFNEFDVFCEDREAFTLSACSESKLLGQYWIESKLKQEFRSRPVNPSEAWVAFKKFRQERDATWSEKSVRCLYVRRTDASVRNQEIRHDLFIVPEDFNDDCVPGIILGRITADGFEPYGEDLDAP